VLSTLRLRALCIATTLAFASTSSLGQAEESILASIGLRIGFSSTTPLLGKQQIESFRLYDVAALLRLPWQWPLGASGWKIQTGIIASLGALEGGGDTGVIATAVPELILSGWNGILSFDAGAGLGGFSRYEFGKQDFGGPVQIVATIGARYSPFTHGYVGFRLHHFSDAGVYGPGALGVDMYIFELGYKF
jgi:hypothetical protein